MSVTKKKTLAVLIACLTAAAAVYGEKITVHLAPLYFTDETEERMSGKTEYRRKLYEELQAVETGRELEFRLTEGEANPPQSVIEAIRVCRNEEADYLLYGYITKRDYTYFGEIKLLDYEKREVVNFFYSVDDHGHEERLLKDLAGKIMTYINDAYQLGLADREARYWELWFPFETGYWTPLGKAWTELETGTAEAGAGLEFVPLDRLFTRMGKGFYLTAGLGVSYRFGLGNLERYDAYNHGITLRGPEIRLNMRLNARHHLSLGTGLLYSFDLLSIREPYKDRELKVYRALGVSGIGGYRFRFTDTWQVYFDNAAEVRFYEKAIVTYSGRIGLSFRMLSREVEGKWD
jgi:hypothetical protein